jgi:UDP-N-acetylmuramyl pentapeptide phosphotransferase/UDP-N-acetylglucosamine-1-phosphate transferase
MIAEETSHLSVELIAIFAGAALICSGLILALRPLLVRYALARPNARSSHREPTPQGGGIAVIAAMTIVLASAAIIVPSLVEAPHQLAIALGCVIVLGVIGATDDIKPLEPLPRLLLQAIAAVIILGVLPPDLHVVSILPWWLERAILFIGLLWFVNLVNFMDGIDWMTVAEVVPVTAALSLFGLLGALPHSATLISLALCGAMIGFAPFNRPVARLFLGDVGSLPIGLILGWLLILLADRHLAAALLLPLYYVADATITLVRRFVRGERVTQAHRTHFYQRATDRGLSVYQIVTRVFLVNIALAGLAMLAVLTESALIQAILLALGCVIVAALLWSFGRQAPPSHARAGAGLTER